MTRRIVARVAIALLAVLLLGGCVDRGRSIDDTQGSGSGSGSGSTGGSAPAARPYEVVQGAYDKLAAAGTARVSTMSTTEVGAIPIDVPGTGGADFRQRSYGLDLNAPTIGAVRIEGIDGVVYARSDFASRTLPGNPEWLRIDAAALAAQGLTAENLDNPFVRFAATTGDALPQLALLKGATDEDTRLIGPEPVDGTPTTHYTASLDFAQARRYAADPKTAADVDRYTKTLRTARLPADVWVDGQGRLRQLKIVFSSVFGRDTTASTTTFSDPGAPVGPFTAPASSTDVADLARRFGN